MNAVVVIVVAAVACLFGGTMADDAVPMVFTDSISSPGSTGGLLGCKPLPTSSSSGPAHLVRFQAARTGGVEYSRVRVPSQRMKFSDVTEMDLGSLNFPECVNAANKKNMGAFSFENGQCVVYKIGDGICPCTDGDLVLYRATSAIRGKKSPKTLTVAKERAGAAPLPAGYTRKIIYPTVSMIGDNFITASSSCEDVLATLVPSSIRPSLLHTVNDQCYYTSGFSKFPCTSCPGIATEVIVMEPPAKQTYLLSKCGGTITVPSIKQTEFAAGPITAEILYSHEGYGCIPYPDPVSDNNCDITLLSPLAGVKLYVTAVNGNIDIDASDDSTCDGDELYVYFGSADTSPCTKKEPLYEGISKVSDRVTIRFQRKPANNKNSVNKGFALVVFLFN